jgi:hypothetical protein
MSARTFRQRVLHTADRHAVLLYIALHVVVLGGAFCWRVTRVESPTTLVHAPVFVPPHALSINPLRGSPP